MKNIFLGLSLALPLFSAASVQGLTLSNQADWTQDAKDAMKIYQSDEGFLREVALNAIMQFHVSAVQANGSNSLHLKDGASSIN